MLGWLFRNKPKKYQEFELGAIALDHIGTSFGFVEYFDVGDFPKHGIPVGTKEFWIDLEDIDEGRNVDTGVVYKCKPRMIRHIGDLEQGAEHDILHFTFDKSGQLSVRYTGPMYVIAHVQWSLSNYKEL